ncbi:hypothetical protein QRO11_03750 [Paracidovorax citrulli]|uniref:hypothetical protein n=1 Tax=Paracidovorax citrulli TaxID=80869 RepID=UPI00147FFB97|nr:hypothetical protein [Paracidovorax citrulli]WIY35466.1 hypothetical protein QRO11_03750 [Paracidovorax citrulli]
MDSRPVTPIFSSVEICLSAIFSYNADMPRFILFLLCIAFLAAAGGLVTIGMALGLVVCFALGAWVTLLLARMFSSSP